MLVGAARPLDSTIAIAPSAPGHALRAHLIGGNLLKGDQPAIRRPPRTRPVVGNFSCDAAARRHDPDAIAGHLVVRDELAVRRPRRLHVLPAIARERSDGRSRCDPLHVDLERAGSIGTERHALAVGRKGEKSVVAFACGQLLGMKRRESRDIRHIAARRRRGRLGRRAESRRPAQAPTAAMTATSNAAKYVTRRGEGRAATSVGAAAGHGARNRRDEPIAARRDRFDVARRFRVVVQRPAQLRHDARQGVVRDRDVLPDDRENLRLVDDLRRAGDQQLKDVQRFRLDRQGAAVAAQLELRRDPARSRRSGSRKEHSSASRGSRRLKDAKG